MESLRNPLIKKVTEETMKNISKRIKLEEKTYNIVYEEVQKMARIVIDSR